VFVGDNQVTTVDVRTMERRSLGGKLASCYCAFAISADGTRLATAELDDRIHLWDVATDAELTVFDGAGGEVTALAFAPDGKILASAHANTTIYLWDLTEVARQ
jgi:WD40 repeat protein